MLNARPPLGASVSCVVNDTCLQSASLLLLRKTTNRGTLPLSGDVKGDTAKHQWRCSRDTGRRQHLSNYPARRVRYHGALIFVSNYHHLQNARPLLAWCNSTLLSSTSWKIRHIYDRKVNKTCLMLVHLYMHVRICLDLLVLLFEVHDVLRIIFTIVAFLTLYYMHNIRNVPTYTQLNMS